MTKSLLLNEKSEILEKDIVGINLKNDVFVVFKGSKMCEIEVSSCPLRTKNKRLAIIDRVTAIYDALVVEKIRTYAYKVYLESGINDYVQLASDIKDCYRIH